MRFLQYFIPAAQGSPNSRHFASLTILVSALIFHTSIPSVAMPLSEPDFDAGHMLRPGSGAASSGTAASFAMAHPARFSMQQSYSLSAMSGPYGSQSSGLYLNTVSYQFTPLLTAFVDVGFHTPLHSSITGPEQGGVMGSLILPRMGFEYRPNERLSLNLELVNGPDAWKAYGGAGAFPRSPHFLQGSLTP